MAGVIPVTAQKHTLRDSVRQWGDIEGGSQGEPEPIDVPTLVERSVLIARVLVVDVDSHLTTDEQSVMTDYTVQILDVEYSARPGVLAGDRVVVSRFNGEIFLEGRRVLYEIRSFPNFKAGEEYVLFLGSAQFPETEAYRSRYGGLRRFSVMSDGWGAFEIANGEARQVFGTDTEGWNGRQPGSVSMFLEDLRTAISQVRESRPGQ